MKNAFFRYVSQFQTTFVQDTLRTHPDFVNALNAEGLTPLHLAIRSCTTKSCSALATAMVHLLLEKGANVNAKIQGDMERYWEKYVEVGVQDFNEPHVVTGYENTPLHEAVTSNQIEIARLLLEKGADVNINNYYDESPLLQISCETDPKIVDLLLKHGAKPNVNMSVFEGDSPLHIATKCRNTEMAKLLLKHGADPMIENGEGATPLQFIISDNRILKLKGMQKENIGKELVKALETTK
ncbi:MAG: hypothetical protein CVV27_01010 [Candidatus Melainabacteria bacterium HGW-Melainabacteria-1]|nr:MAG: hypothetical protein CVV27_01010 [Candidatus Melainabacteria bacterium HGW-Melainabacteria-1]